MQNDSAKRNQRPEDDARRAADSEINERLVEHLKANAIRPDKSQTAEDRLPNRGFFGEAYALLGLVGLMIVAYVYSLFVGQEA